MGVLTPTPAPISSSIYYGAQSKPQVLGASVSSPQPAPAPYYSAPQSTQGYANPTAPPMSIPTAPQSIPTSNPTSGGSSGGSNNTGGNTSGGQAAAPDFSAELNSIFQPIFDAFGQQESSTNANYQTQVGDINQQGTAAQSSLDTQKATSERGLNELAVNAGNVKNDAYTAATRLYSELNRGGQQRFGGSSSAGEAFGALTAVEQQRRQGSIQQAYEGAMQKVAGFKNDLIAKFDDAKIQLQSAITTQLANARQQWTDAMSAISTAKSQAQSDKASASYNALNDYRNKVYAINSSGIDAMRSLAANHEVNLKSVDDYTQRVVNSLASGGTEVANFGVNANNVAGSTTLGIGANKSVAPTNTYTGAIAPTTQKKDLYGNLIA